MEHPVRDSVFSENGIEKLEFDYVPSRLPHREEQISNLVSFFRLIIDRPGVLSERILITGSSGTGKTSASRSSLCKHWLSFC